MVRPSFIKSLNTDGECKMTIKDWLEEIICYNDFSCFIRRVIRFIKRLFRWIPVLWNQEEWDFGYTYDILKLKLQEIRKDIENDKIHTEDCIKEELEQIDSVLDHLDKFRHWEDYIDIPVPSEDFERYTPLEDGCYSVNITKEERKAYEKARKFEQKHYNAFWNELKKYSNNWWV